jgi:hypothetical protein
LEIIKIKKRKTGFFAKTKKDVNMEILLPTEYNEPKEVFELWKYFRKQVVACLEKTPADIFIVNPDPTRWSISEVAEHLYITQFNLSRSFPIVMAGKFGEDFKGYEKEMNYAIIRRTMMKPTKIQNPKSVSPLNKYSYSELIPLLNDSESKMEKFVNKYSKEQMQSRAMEHPIFGFLNVFDFFWVMTMHEKSHLTAIEERTKDF